MNEVIVALSLVQGFEQLLPPARWMFCLQARESFVLKKGPCLDIEPVQVSLDIEAKSSLSRISELGIVILKICVRGAESYRVVPKLGHALKFAATHVHRNARQGGVPSPALARDCLHMRRPVVHAGCGFQRVL